MGLLYNYIAQVLMVIARDDDNQCLQLITIYYKDLFLYILGAYGKRA